MIREPRKFGSPLGRFHPIEPESVEISLRDNGVNLSVSASQLGEGESPNAIDVRFVEGGVTGDYATALFGSAYAGAQDRNVIYIAPFQKEDGTKFLMRCRPTAWDRWNGTNWLTLAGALSAVVADRIYHTVFNDKFIVANAVDKLKFWNGNDATAVADLSADAPIARYVTRLGGRLLAAGIKVGGVMNPNLIARSADGDETNWTTLGAGSAELQPEGSDDAPNYITGLSTLERGAVIYRQRSIVLGMLTGVSAAPIKYQTVDFSHGTESPYSIASGGMKTGDFFMGHDYMPYNFDGKGEPVPIGEPIYDLLRTSVPDLSQVIGAVDINEQEYWLAFPSVPGTTLDTAWVFSIRQWLLRNRLVWRKRTLPANTKSFGFGTIATVTDPIVNTITDIVDTLHIRVDDWGRSAGPDRILFGDYVGQIHNIDKGTLKSGGSWESRQFVFDGQVKTLDRIRIRYKAPANATVSIDVSTDGGRTFSLPQVHNLTATGTAQEYSTGEHRTTSRQFQYRIRPLTGFATITEVQLTFQPKGRGND